MKPFEFHIKYWLVEKLVHVYTSSIELKKNDNVTDDQSRNT